MIRPNVSHGLRHLAIIGVVLLVVLTGCGSPDDGAEPEDMEENTPTDNEAGAEPAAPPENNSTATATPMQTSPDGDDESAARESSLPEPEMERPHSGTVAVWP